MNAVHQTIARTRRRVFFDTWLRMLGWLTLVWVGLACLILLSERLASLSIPLPPAWVYGGSAGLLFLIAPILAWRRRPDDETTAAMIDDRLELKDSLGTALYVEQLEDNAFTQEVLDSADRAASTARIEQAFEIRLGRGWGVALPAAVIFGLLVVFVPTGLDLLGLNENKTQQEQQQAQAQEVKRQVLQANALLKEVQTDESELVEADPDDVFKELASLTDRDLANPDFKRQTMTKLADVQDRLAAAEKTKRQQVNQTKNQMSQLNPGTRGPADRFADAMRRGDFDAAQKELQRLADSLEGMPESEKQLLQQQLQNMADQLEQMAEKQKELEQQAQEQIEKQLEQAGLNEQQIQQLRQQGYNQQAVQQAVQQAQQAQGKSEQQSQQQAQQTAQQVQQLNQQSQNANQSSQQNSGMSQSFNQLSQSLNPPSQQQQGQQGQPQNQQSQQGQQQQQGQQGQQQGQGQQQSQQGQQQQGQQQSQQGQQQGQGQGQQQGQQQGQSQQQNQFSQGAWQTQQQLQQMSQMQNQLQQMQNSQQQMQQAMQQMQQGQGGQGQQPQQQGQGRGSQPNQGSGVGGKEAGTGYDPNPLGAERQTGPYTTTAEHDIQQGQGRVIASWQENGEMSAGEATVEFDQAITEARSDAEHAVTEDRVPRRYHDSIKDYFQQLPDSPDEVRQAPAAPR